MTAFWAIILVLSSNIILSLGMLLQKRHIGWMGVRQEAKARKQAGDGQAGAGARGSGEYRRDLAGWAVGFTLMNLAPVPRYFSLMGLPVNVVNAFFGANVAFTAIMAYFILGEVPTRKQLGWSAFLLAALVVASVRGGLPETDLDRVWLVVFFGIPALLGGLAWLKRRKAPSKGLAVFLAIASGSMGGYMNLPMKAVQTGGLDLLALAFFVAIYLAAGALSFFLIQFAYKDGDMSTVSPAMYGFQVLWPALATFFVFGSVVDPVQVAALAAIALGVVMVSSPGPRQGERAGT